jgi:hypothetical protein
VGAHTAESQAILVRIEKDFGPERLEQLLDLLQDLRALNLR